MTDLTEGEKAYFESGGVTDPAETPTEPVVTEGEPSAAEPAQPSTPETPTEEFTKTVPHAALHAEREEHKKAKARALSLEAENKAQRDTLNQILEKFRAASEPETPVDDDPEPDMRQNIFEHMEWQKRQNFKFQQTIEADRRAQREMQERSTADQQIWSKWDQDSADFSKTATDFDAARAYLSDARDRQLAALAGIEPAMANQAARNQRIDAELSNLISLSAATGQNAAQVVYEYAKAAGYAPAAPVVPKVEAPKADLANLQRGMDASKTLSAARGGASSELTTEDLLAMPLPELKKWMNKNPKNEAYFNKMLGG